MGRNQHGTKGIPTDKAQLEIIKNDLEEAVLQGKKVSEQMQILREVHGIEMGRTFFVKFRKELGVLTSRQSSDIPENVVVQLVLEIAGLIDKQGNPTKQALEGSAMGHGVHYVRAEMKNQHKMVLPFSRVRAILQSNDPAGMVRRAPKNLDKLKMLASQRPPRAPRPPAKNPRKPRNDIEETDSGNVQHHSMQSIESQIQSELPETSTSDALQAAIAAHELAASASAGPSTNSHESTEQFATLHDIPVDPSLR